MPEHVQRVALEMQVLADVVRPANIDASGARKLLGTEVRGEPPVDDCALGRRRRRFRESGVSDLLDRLRSRRGVVLEADVQPQLHRERERPRPLVLGQQQRRVVRSAWVVCDDPVPDRVHSVIQSCAHQAHQPDGDVAVVEHQVRVVRLLHAVRPVVQVRVRRHSLVRAVGVPVERPHVAQDVLACRLVDVPWTSEAALFP